ncbi:MAG TPA: aldehyde dehydrogenase family protein, partial [Anaerolineaceae bacterium]|nr:aldehyde dehydrogenase family protein [Anaerolineaceae bacterium]
MSITSINPATGETIREYETFSDQQIQDAVTKAHAAWLQWRKTAFTQRAELMRKAAQGLRRQKDELARLMTMEMGKPVRQGVAEVEKCAWVCEYYADHAEAHLAPDEVKSDAYHSYV